MFTTLSGLLSLLLLLGTARAQEGEMEDSSLGIRIKAVGKSGKIQVAPADNYTVSSSPDRVTFDWAELAELDSTGTPLPNSLKHKFNTFANQDFTIGQVTQGDVQGLEAEYFEFEADLSSVSATLKVTVYLIKEDGNITIDGETTEVEAGSMKWAIELSGWSWCSPCSQGPTEYTGAFVDFVVEIKGKGAPQPSDDGGDTDNYSVGNAKLQLSKKVKVGDTWTDMPAGFPSLTTQGSKTLFTFRFARDGDSAFFYDPTLSFDGSGSGTGSGSTGAAVSLASLLAILFALVLNY